VDHIKLFFITVSFLIVGCGSQSGGTGSGSGDADAGGGSAVTPAEFQIQLVSDKASIATGGIDQATITALVTNINNVVVSEQAVTFSSDDGTLSSVDTQTNLSGAATAVLSSGSSLENKTIVVTVTVEGVSQTLNVEATGSTLTVSGASTVAAGASTPVTVTLTNGGSAAIAGEPVTFSSSSNTVTPGSATTDANGQAVVTVGPANSTETISIAALNNSVTGTYQLNVASSSSDVILFTTPASGASLGIDTDHSITINWQSGGSPVATTNVVVSTTKGDLDTVTAGIQSVITVTTDASGNATFQTRSADIGSAVITAQDPTDSLPTASLSVNFVATVAGGLSVEAVPSTIAIGTTSTLVATVLDAADVNPIPGQSVAFSAVGSNGLISQPTATTDLNGRATVVYTGGTSATSEDGVTITATLLSNTALTGVTQMTITQPLLNIAAGTGNQIVELGTVELGQSYLVLVNDGQGDPVPSAEVTVVARPVKYKKGRLVQIDTSVPADSTPDVWGFDSSGLNSVECTAEDVNNNGRIDAGEDIDGDGVLDPQNSVSIRATTEALETPTVVGGVITTDVSGRGYFLMSYPRSHARWATIELEITARFGNTESTARILSGLSGVASDYTDLAVSPPGQISPFGINPGFGTTLAPIAPDCVTPD
jgi:hypothetical protein